MPTEIKPIETLYRGYRFRSRMEARWAVFMDHLGVKFDYEPEAYALPSGGYLPDFFVPELDAYIEIKNPEVKDRDDRKILDLASATRKIVYVFRVPPTFPDWSDFDHEGAEAFFPDGGWDSHYLWCECKTCHKVGIQFDGRAYRIHCNCPREGHSDKGYNYDSPRLKRCYEIARGWRFEPGAEN